VAVVEQLELGLFCVFPEQLGLIARIFLEFLDYDEAEWISVGHPLHVLLTLLGIVSELSLHLKTLVVLLLLLSMDLNYILRMKIFLRLVLVKLVLCLIAQQYKMACEQVLRKVKLLYRTLHRADFYRVKTGHDVS